MSNSKDHSPAPENEQAWHALDIENIFARLESSAKGLNSETARQRLEQYGPNRLRQEKRRSNWALLLAQFKNVLIYVLLGAAAVTLLIGHYIDAAVIFGVVILNALIGFIQEGKAEKALDSIRNLLSPHATVLRDNKQLTIDAENLVPG
ncbi:MAG: cation-transporting P-type ATPase, partial [Desulfovibrionales bacterium]